LIVLVLASSGCATPLRYHYPRQAGEVDLALDRLERTVELAEEEKALSAAHRAAAAAAKEARSVLERPRIEEAAMARALEAAAAKLEGAADVARGAISPERAGVHRDRLFDVERQARRAAREARALGRSITVAQ
jgi:hypothetical protein